MFPPSMTFEVDMESHFLTVNDFTSEFRVGRTKTYELIKSGQLPVKKVGRRTLIPRPGARVWAENLPGREASKVK